MKKKMLLPLLLFFILFPLPVFCQNTIGLPEITNYTIEDFHGGTQTWDIAQDKVGITYFANNEGLLTFNGSYWKLYPIPNKTNVRSVAIDEKGRIYIGAQDEIGYFFPDNRGELKYTSLKSLVPESARHFADIWDIVLADGEVFFRAKNLILQLVDNKIRVFSAPSEWRFLCKSGDQIMAQDKAKGLMVFKNNQWEVACPAFAGENPLITAIMPYSNDGLLIATLKNGLFLLKESTLTKKYTGLDNVFTNDHIYSGIRLNENWFAMGTVSGGCFIIDQNGKMIQKFSRREGLQNNNVLSLFLDKDMNLWMGLDNGIDFVANASAIKHIYPDQETQITGYTTRICNGQLFIGTSNGLYRTPLEKGEKDLSFSKGNFSLVKNSLGQVWNLSVINNRLLMGHHEGSFIVNEDQVQPLQNSNAGGSWLFQPLSSFNSDNIIAGTYEGLQLLHFKNGKFTAPEALKEVAESFRFVALDNDTSIIWASHPYRGVYKLKLAPDKRSIVQYTLYTEKNGLPSALNNYIFRVRNKTVVATKIGIYEYNAALNKFESSGFFSTIFKKQEVRYLNEDQYGNIWFVTGKDPGVVDFQKNAGNGEAYTVVNFPELSGKILNGFENIYPYDLQNIFIGGKKGIFHLNYYQYTHNTTELNVVLGQVKMISKEDSLIFGGYFSKGKEIVSAQETDQILSVPNKWNSFHFEYASTLYAQHNNTTFSYRLFPFDKGWSEWSAKTEKDYTNLPYGTYTFLVRARNNLGNESKPVSYTFKVEPAWYQTIGAYFLYFVLLASLVYVILKRQEKKLAKQQLKHQEEQQRLKYLYQLELDKNEKEIIALQNEKLEAEVHFKNKELATVTMNLVERGKFLSRIKEELKKLLESVQSFTPSDEFKSVIRLLNEAEKSTDDWEHFSIHFDQVHNDFLANMKKQFPNLSATDLKMCAYLKMNLSSKEIAQLLNISLKGVEISRYRLRKKLDIATEVSLYDYLMKITT